jgi:hypothetical protein
MQLSPASNPKAKAGGGERDRTDGLLVANQALSQLSYTPRFKQGDRAAHLYHGQGHRRLRIAYTRAHRFAWWA